MLHHACLLGLEGIVGKNRNSLYRSGRTGDWIKLKCVQSEAFLVVGYEPASNGGFRSLLLAAYENEELRYVGSVGTGFKANDVAKLRKLLGQLSWRKKTPPVSYTGKRDVVWVQPTLIAEIEFRQITRDGKLRHSAYKGLREIQDNAAVMRLR